MDDVPPAAGGDTKTCPYCAETIKAAAVVCRYCGRDLTAIAVATPVVVNVPPAPAPPPALSAPPTREVVYLDKQKGSSWWGGCFQAIGLIVVLIIVLFIVRSCFF